MTGGCRASSKNYRYAVKMQVVINANARLSVAVGRPTPGNRDDCRAYRNPRVDRHCHSATVMADGGYQGNPRCDHALSHLSQRQPAPGWKHDLNTIHKRVRARVEHALAHLKTWNVLCNRRRKRDGVW